MKINILIFLFLSVYINTHSQNTFEYTYSTPNNEFSLCLAEDGEGNILIPIINYQYALIIKLDPEGKFLDSLSIHNSEGTCKLEYLIKLDAEHIGALGNWYTDSTAQFWYVLLDNNLQILEDKKINSNNCHVTGFQAIINFRGNIVFSAGYYPLETRSENVCMYEITTDGELINNHFYFSPNAFNLTCALLESEFEGQYKIFSTGRLDTTQTRFASSINIVDTNFNFIGSAIVQNTSIQPRVSALWFDDSTYLMAGKWLPWFSDDWDMGILKLTRNDSILSSASFGKVDTTDWSANYTCIDFISNNHIFFIGSNNTVQPYFQGSPSWIMVNILDSALGLKSQQFFGGDAYYNVMSVLATQDSGCVISCTRYDYLNRPDDYDTYILKVNKDGLLVSIPENQIGSTHICNIYPNPGRDIINIESYLDNCQFDLVNLTGNSVLSSRLNIGVNTMYVANLPNGIYLYRILDENDNLVQTGKWIKYE